MNVNIATWIPPAMDIWALTQADFSDKYALYDAICPCISQAVDPSSSLDNLWPL